jgi:hypothetical protein
VNLGGHREKVYLPTVAAWKYIAHEQDANHLSYNIYNGIDWSIGYGTSYQLFDYLGSAMFFGGKKWQQDIVSWDTYPITQQLHNKMNLNQTTYPKWGPYGIWLDMIDRSIANNKNITPFIAILQPCAGLTPMVVSEAQTYMEAWLAVIHGAKGITWFNYFYMNTTGTWTSMLKFARQIESAPGTLTDLGKAILAAPPARTVTDTANPLNSHNAAYDVNRVDTMIRQDSNYIYVITARVTEPVPANSYLSVYVTGTPGTVIPSGSIVRDNASNEWVSVANTTLGSQGTANVQVVCSTAGQITASAGTITTIVTPVAGWNTVTNNQTANIGSYYQSVEPATLSGVQFTVSDLGTTTATVLDEDRSVSVVDGVFSDDFDKNAVHIYRIPLSETPPTYYAMTVTKAGLGSGQVTSANSEINCGGTCAADILAGNSITLTATSNITSSFDGWSSGSGGAEACSGTGTCVVSSIAEASSVIATFSIKETPPDYYNMSISYIGIGNGVTDPVSGNYSEGAGTEVTVTATADANSTFTGFTGTCGCTASPCTIASFPGNDCTVIAEFIRNPEYWLNVVLSAGINTLTSNVGISCTYSPDQPCQFKVASDTEVIFAVIPLSGYYGCVFSGCSNTTCLMTSDKTFSVSCTNGRAMTLGTGGTITLGGSGTITY